ncbi:hypothetical protein MTP99_010536 [Tenebrio molitor]|nr:hypothetical protein MTP99_010536 [Tenebrio molitor]
MKVTVKAADTPVLDDNNIQFALKNAMLVAQFFGFFPLHGVTSSSPGSLKFSWISIKTIYACFTFLMTVFSAVCQLYRMVTVEINILQMNCFIYLICPVFSSVFFIKLAKEWPQFMKDWHSVEIAMGNFGISTNTKRKINLILGWFTLGFLVDHIPLESYRLVDSIKCSKTLSDGIRHYYVNASFPFIFDGPLDYSLWKAAIFQVTNFQITFCWIYIDTFIILISQAFAVRMNQSRAKIEALIASKVKTILVWRNVREEHHRLCRLCFQLDQKISYLVLMSFFGNLYFLLAQLFNTLRPINDILQRIAASINDENRNILRQLLSTPSVVYNFEIERLIYQITHKSVGISGKNFFQITRGLILKIAGAIVAYELVLIQFNNYLLQEPENMQHHILDNGSYWLC